MINLRLRETRPSRRLTSWLIVEPGKACAFCGPAWCRSDALYHARWHGTFR